MTTNYHSGMRPLKSAAEALREMLDSENAALRERVADLERKAAEQEDELICLRASMADVLRRLGILETTANMAIVNGSTPIGRNNLSKSTSNLRRNLSSHSSAHNSPQTAANLHQRRVSASPRRIGSMSHLYQNGNHSPARSASHHGGIPPTPGGRHGGGQDGHHHPPPAPSALMSQSLAMAAGGSQSSVNIKKWVSNASFTDSGSRQSLSSPNPKRFGSAVSLSSSSRSLVHLGVQKEPSYIEDENCLRLHFRNRTVNLYAPSSVEDFNPHQPLPAPAEKLKLEWVYGYRGRDCRSNLYLLPTGELVYFVAEIIVLYNLEEQMQRHYLGHTDDVKCLALHPNRILVASGQLTKSGGTRNRRTPTSTSPDMGCLPEEAECMPHVRIWDSISLQTQQIIGIGEFERAVSCIAFSKTDGGHLLAVVDESYDHTLSVWEWQKRQKLAETKSANEQVFACEFHPTDKTCLVTCGKSQLNFWQFDDATFQRKPAVFESRDKPKYVLCIAFSENGDVLSGDSNGTITVWNASSAKLQKCARNVHDGGVFSICALKAGRIISGGGKDRRLVEWDEQLRKTGSEVELPENAGPVRTIVQGKGSMLLVGTTSNCILQGSLRLNFNFVVQGHFDELYGLAAHPHQRQFLTCGFDKTLRLWDSISRRVIWIKEIADPAYCCSFHPGASVLAVGTTVGRWLVLDAITREIVIGQVDGNDIIAAVVFSPDGQFLAVASYDNSVYVYKVSEDARKYARVGKCIGHNSFIARLDWATNSEYFRTNSDDHELLFWHAPTCKQVSGETARDFNWDSDHCSVSWSTAGVWPDSADPGYEIHSVDRSSRGSLLATGDEMGLVKVFRNPCPQPRSGFHAYSGHSSHVTGVRFLEGGTRLTSIGGKDSMVLQWIVQ